MKLSILIGLLVCSVNAFAAEDGLAIVKYEMANDLKKCTRSIFEITGETIASQQVNGRDIGVHLPIKPQVLSQSSAQITVSIQGFMDGTSYSAILTVRSSDCAEMGSYSFAN